ncbi:MAG: T9SS type B sorting domain-containing protein [Flavobacterium sp.]
MKQALFFLFLLVSSTITAQYTLIPDINFEKALISLGIDNGSPDGKVFTSSISNLSTLSIGGRNISDLTGIEDFINLTELRCQANNLTTLDLSKNLKLEELDCYSNQLINLNVTKNLNLKSIECQENRLTSLDVSSNINLITLDFDNNYITNIDVSKNIGLQGLQVNFNLLKNLDVSKNINLMNLQCVENQLKILDLSKNPDLYLLYCRNNQLTSLDISKNPKINYVSCYSNNLTSLNLKNGKNTIFNTSFFYYCNFKFNPDLKCILVDNSAYSNTNWSTLKDATASYSDILDVAPTISSTQSFCKEENKTLNNIIIKTGQNIKWYDALTNGNLLLDTTLLQNGLTYYASQTINGCESERAPVLINIQNTPAPTGNANQPFCSSQNPTLQNISSTGQNIKWYDAVTNGNILPKNTNLQNGITYYASQTVNSCESQRLAITVSIQNTPTIPTGDTNPKFCKIENATLNNISINGQNLKWYDSNIATIPLANNTLLQNNTTYYVSQTLGCESDRLAVLVNVNDSPLATANTSQTFCIDENATISNIVITGNNLKWYDSPTEENLLPTTTTLENKTYYVTQTNTNCESQRLAIVLKIQDTKAPIAETNQHFCVQQNATINNIQISGQNLKWYNANTAGTNLSESTPLENGITYFASQTIANCESERIPITIQIYEATTADCINFVDELPFPKFFTPNGDDYNDNWKIDFAYLAPNSVIRIFDRYGKMLKELNSNSNGWKGTFNGAELPASDYWFVVTRANGTEYRGHFSLKR